MLFWEHRPGAAAGVWDRRGAAAPHPGASEYTPFNDGMRPNEAPTGNLIVLVVCVCVSVQPEGYMPRVWLPARRPCRLRLGGTRAFGVKTARCWAVRTIDIRQVCASSGSAAYIRNQTTRNPGMTPPAPEFLLLSLKANKRRKFSCPAVK